MQRYVDVWSQFREKIQKDIHKKGWNADIGAFVQAYGENHLDAAKTTTAAAATAAAAAHRANRIG